MGIQGLMEFKGSLPAAVFTFPRCMWRTENSEWELNWAGLGMKTKLNCAHTAETFTQKLLGTILDPGPALVLLLPTQGSENLIPCS